MIRALILIALGALALAVAWKGQQSGELPAGSNFLRPYRPNRDDQPLSFRFHLALYYCGGMALAVWGLMALVGLAAAPEWRYW